MDAQLIRHSGESLNPVGLKHWTPAFARKGQAAVVKLLKQQQPRTAGATV
jgi:hypothetical protein